MAEFPKRAKTVIIGLGGIVGASVAHHLIERGWDDIVGIDQSGIPTDIGSTAHASDFCYTTSHDFLSCWTTLYSIGFYEKMGHYSRIGGLEVARGGEFSLKIETAASGRSNIEYETGGAAGALCERHVGNFNSTLRPYGEGKMEMLSVDVTWRVALLSAVFAADLLMFISLCREELRDWRVSRYSPVPVAKALSAPSSNTR